MSIYKPEEKELFDMVVKYTTYKHNCKVWHKLAKRFPDTIHKIPKPDWRAYVEIAKKLQKEEKEAINARN